MSLRLGDEAPDFTAATTEGEISFHDHLGDGWGILFSHPADFTPVCTTELAAAARLKGAFEERGCRIVGLSVDPLDSHAKWAADIEETQGQALNFPVIADHDRKVSALYDMIHPNAAETVTVRSVFFIGPDKRIKATITYPPSTGRNFEEVLRTLDSLQLTARHKVATPVDWRRGDDVIILPSIGSEEAKQLFPDGWDERKPYLRIVPQPKG